MENLINTKIGLNNERFFFRLKRHHVFRCNCPFLAVRVKGNTSILPIYDFFVVVAVNNIGCNIDVPQFGDYNDYYG